MVWKSQKLKFFPGIWSEILYTNHIKPLYVSFFHFKKYKKTPDLNNNRSNESSQNSTHKEV